MISVLPGSSSHSVILSSTAIPQISSSTIHAPGHSVSTSTWSDSSIDTVITGVSNPQMTIITTVPIGSPGTTYTFAGSLVDIVIIVNSNIGPQKTLSTFAPPRRLEYTTVFGSNGIDTVITATSSPQPTHTSSTIPKKVEHSYTWTARLSSAPEFVAISTINPPGQPGFALTYPGTPYETIIAVLSGSHPTTALLTLASNAYTFTF